MRAHRAPRKSVPRSSSGCLVCRKRRVRCGQEHPQCTRCVDAGWHCEYEASRSGARPARRRMITRSVLCLELTAYALPFKVPGSQCDRKALHYFYTRAGEDFSLPFPSTFWTDILFRRCQSESVIRQAVIALAVMHNDFIRLSGPGSETLLCYNRATYSLRKYIQTECAPSRSTVLLCCACLICFDMMRGETEMALQHLENGISVINEWFAGRREAGESGDLPIIWAIYRRMDYQACMWNQERQPALRKHDHVSHLDVLSSSREPFKSLQEAQSCWLSLFGLALSYFSRSAPFRHHTHWSDTPQDIRFERSRLQQQFQNWSKKLHPSFLRLEAKDNIRAGIQAMLLKHRFTELLLAGSIRDPTIQANIDSEADQLLVLAHAIRGCHSAGTASLTYLAYVAPMTLLALKATDSLVREQATILLKGLPKTSLVWHIPVRRAVAELGFFMSDCSTGNTSLINQRAKALVVEIEYTYDRRSMQNAQCE